MKNIKIVNACSMNFAPIRVEINEASYKMKRNDAQFITLPSGQYELTIRQDWIMKRTMITVEDNDMEIFIHRVFPEVFFGLGLGIGIMLYTLYFVSMISILIPSIFVLIFASLFMYYSLIRTKKYFKITVYQK